MLLAAGLLYSLAWVVVNVYLVAGLQCEAVTDIDVTAAEVLKDLDEELNAKGVHLAFVELRDRLADLIVRYDLDATLQAEHFYASVEEAVAALASERDGGPAGAGS